MAAALVNWVVRSGNERLGLEQWLGGLGSVLAFTTLALGAAVVIYAESRSERTWGAAGVVLGVLGLVPAVGLLIVFVVFIVGGVDYRFVIGAEGWLAGVRL